jgi:ubiquitin-protein ligase
MSRRYERLYVEYERLKFLFANHPNIRIAEVAGDPPDQYVIQYFVRGLVEAKTGIEVRGEHLVRITLGPSYPNEAPYCAMLTPVFHPNIDGFKICTEDVSPAGRRLDQIIVFIGRLISCQAYNLASPRNGAARAWAEEHRDRFPLENTELLPQAIQDGIPLPVFRAADIRALRAPAGPATAFEAAPPPPPIPDRQPAWSEPVGPPPPAYATPSAANLPSCANCGATAPVQACSNAHLICPDCSMPCVECGRDLCAVCAPSTCQECSMQLCADCGLQCKCGAILCTAHSQFCAICRTPVCWGCLAMCARCAVFCCRSHLDPSGRCPTCATPAPRNPPLAKPEPGRPPAQSVAMVAGSFSAAQPVAMAASFSPPAQPATIAAGFPLPAQSVPMAADFFPASPAESPKLLFELVGTGKKSGQSKIILLVAAGLLLVVLLFTVSQRVVERTSQAAEARLNEGTYRVLRSDDGLSCQFSQDMSISMGSGLNGSISGVQNHFKCKDMASHRESEIELDSAGLENGKVAIRTKKFGVIYRGNETGKFDVYEMTDGQITHLKTYLRSNGG